MMAAGIRQSPLCIEFQYKEGGFNLSKRKEAVTK